MMKTRKKKFSEELSEFAGRLDFVMNETDDRWIFTRNNLQISLRKSRSEKTDARRAERVLNEGMTDLPSAGFFGASSGHPYCEYKIIPLSHNLEQRVIPRKTKGDIIQVGSYVQGKDKEGNVYNGKVQKFKRDEWNDIQEVFILAKELGSIVSLVPKTVNLSTPYPKISRKSDGFYMDGDALFPFGS